MTRVILSLVVVGAIFALAWAMFGRTGPGSGKSPNEANGGIRIEIITDPAGASLSVDGKYYGRTPMALYAWAGQPFNYRVEVEEFGGDYKLYKPFSGSFTPTESASISVWIERTTAEEQAAQLQAAENRRREAQAAADKAAQERERRIEAERLYYRIQSNCSAGVDITYSNANGDTTQQSNQGNGWYYSFVPRSGQHLYLSAQNQCSSGYVTVKFVKDGVTLRENTSTGGYVIATVSARW